MKNDKNENKALSQTAVSGSVILPAELKIGNYVNSKNDGIIRITNISEKSVAVSEQHSYNHIPINLIQPIPLTGDLLNKLGFEWSIFHQAYHKENFEYVVDFYENYPQCNCNLGFLKKYTRNGETLISVKFVHELQNLYFVLKNEDIVLTDR